MPSKPKTTETPVLPTQADQLSGITWKVHTKNLLAEVLENKTAWVLRQPLNILHDLMLKVAQRAIELDDKELNKLMLRLTLYSVAEPGNPDYDPKWVAAYLKDE